MAVALASARRNPRTYRQTGVKDTNLGKGLLGAAAAMEALCPFDSWDSCDNEVAKLTTLHCRGDKLDSSVPGRSPQTCFALRAASVEEERASSLRCLG